MVGSNIIVRNNILKETINQKQFVLQRQELTILKPYFNFTV